MPDNNFKVGDIVRLTRVPEDMQTYFSVGDLAKIYKRDFDGDFWADFCNMGNNVCDDGRWCIGKNSCGDRYSNFELCEEKQND